MSNKARRVPLKRLGLAAAAMTLAVGVCSARATTVSYNTGFENPPFATGSINGQDGWTVTNPSFNQSVTTAAAHSGTQSWFRSNNYTTLSFGDQPLSAPLPSGVKAGESSAVGVTTGYSSASFSVWFRAANTLAADGTFVSLSLTDTNGSRIDYAGIANTDSGGLTLVAYDASSNGFGNTATFNSFDLTPTALDRTAWHELVVQTTFLDGANNDVVKYYVDGALKATTGSWEDYYRNDPEQAGNGNQLYAVDRVGFYTRSPSGTANGLYFDDFGVSASTVPLPAAAWMGISLIGGLGGIRGIKNRLRRQKA